MMLCMKFGQKNNRLNMHTAWEHINRLDDDNLVAVAQEGEIAGKCCGIATDVYDPFTIGVSNDLKRGGVEPFSRRVNDNDIEYQDIFLFAKPR